MFVLNEKIKLLPNWLSSRVCNVLDRFEPRALHYCDQEQHNHFDICKSYHNVLLKNEQPMPVYSIHDLKKNWIILHR